MLEALGARGPVAAGSGGAEGAPPPPEEAALRAVVARCRLTLSNPR